MKSQPPVLDTKNIHCQKTYTKKMRRRLLTKINKKTAWILFILLLCHSPLKWLTGFVLIGLSIISFSRKGVSNFEIKCIALISLLIFLGALLNLVYNQNIQGIFLGTYLLSPMILIPFLYSNYRNRESIRSALVIFTYIQALFVAAQYLYLVIKTGDINPFDTNKSLGDFIAGTFLSFSTPLAVSFVFIATFFLYDFYTTGKKNSVWLSIVSSLIAFSTGAMSVAILLIPLYVLIILIKTIKSKVSNSKKIIYLGMFFIASIIVGAWQIQNILYSTYLADKIQNTAPPLKLEIAMNVANNVISGDEFLWGVGIGNFTSRASLFLSGQYLSDQLLVPVAPSDISKELILPFYNINYRGVEYNGYDSLSVVSEPFSQFTTITSEFGLFGSIIFLLFLSNMFLISIRKNNLLYFSCSALTVILFISNNWFEYASFPAIFYLMYAYPKAEKNAHKTDPAK